MLADSAVSVLADLADGGDTLLAANQTVASFTWVRLRITIHNWVFLETDNRAIKLLLTRLAFFANADLAVSLRALLAGFFDSEVAGSIERCSLDANLAVTLGTWVLDSWM